MGNGEFHTLILNNSFVSSFKKILNEIFIYGTIDSNSPFFIGAKED